MRFFLAQQSNSIEACESENNKNWSVAHFAETNYYVREQIIFLTSLCIFSISKGNTWQLDLPLDKSSKNNELGVKRRVKCQKTAIHVFTLNKTITIFNRFNKKSRWNWCFFPMIVLYGWLNDLKRATTVQCPLHLYIFNILM